MKTRGYGHSVPITPLAWFLRTYRGMTTTRNTEDKMQGAILTFTVLDGLTEKGNSHTIAVGPDTILAYITKTRQIECLSNHMYMHRHGYERNEQILRGALRSAYNRSGGDRAEVLEALRNVTGDRSWK